MSSSEQVSGPHGEHGLLPRLLAGLVVLICRAPRFTLALIAVSIGLSVYFACTRLEYHTHRNDLISPNKEVLRRWNHYIDEFGKDDDMVVVVQGDGPSSHAQMTAALESLATRIQTHPDHFDRLFYKVDLRFLSERALLFLPTDELRDIQKNLDRMKPLLASPLAWKFFSLHNMAAEAQSRLVKLPPGQQPPAEDIPLLEQLLSAVRSARATLADPNKYRNPWTALVKQPERTGDVSAQDLLARPQYFFSGDGKLAFLLVRPSCKTDGFIGPHESVDQLRKLVDELRPANPSLQMGVTGLPVLETDEMIASQNDTNFASWLALVGVALVYLLAFRSLRSPFLTVSTLMVGTGWAMGWLTLTVGHLNLLSSTFAIMLIGMGDYGVLWVTRYQQERATGLDIAGALRVTALGVGPGILTAGVTTGLAFFAAMLADFLAVAELGWIAGCGVILCAIACFTFLPALIMIVDGRKEKAGERHILSFQEEKESIAGARMWLPGLVGRPRWVLGGGLALVGFLGVWSCTVRYDHNLLNLQAESLDSVKWERTLIRHTAGASWHALSHTDSREKALELKEKFEKLPTVERVVEVASLVPSAQDRKLPMLRDIHERLAHLPARESIAPLPSSPAALVSELRKLPGAKQGLVADLSRESKQLADQVEAMPPALASERLKLFEAKLTADLCEDLHKLYDVSKPEPIVLNDMPKSLRERYVSDSGRWLLRVFGRESLWEYKPLSDFIASVQTVDPEATGKPFTTLEGLQAMKRGFQWAGVYALIAIIVVLILDFRKTGPVLLALGPLAVGMLLALGVMGLFGFHLNPANMIALPLIVGVGVDNGVHVIHDFLDREKGKPYALRRSTGTGILVAGLTTLLGFGTLMLSSHRGLSGLGFILSLGVAGSMLTALVFLPAGLKLWSERGIKHVLKSDRIRSAA